MLIADDILLVKNGAQSWPAIRYWVSAKARDAIRHLSGYNRGGNICPAPSMFFHVDSAVSGDYVEYFGEDGLGEYAFVSDRSLVPLEATNMPKKPSKKFDAFLESARKEKLAVDSVIEVNVNFIVVYCHLFCPGDRFGFAQECLWFAARH